MGEMDETAPLLQRYEGVLGLYKYTNEVRQSRISWGLGLETALVAAVAAFGDHKAVAVAASALGAALAVALVLIVRRHSRHAVLWSAEGREIEASLEDVSGGQLVFTAFRNEKSVFGPKGTRSTTFPHTDETVTAGWLPVSANCAEEVLIAFLCGGWLVVLILFLLGRLEIRGG